MSIRHTAAYCISLSGSNKAVSISTVCCVSCLLRVCTPSVLFGQMLALVNTSSRGGGDILI